GPAERLAVEHDPARAAHCSRDGAERGRLAGAVRAEDGDDRPFLDGKRDAVEDVNRPVARLDVLELEERSHAASSPPRYASMTAGSRCTSAGAPEAIVRPKLRT